MISGAFDNQWERSEDYRADLFAHLVDNERVPTAELVLEDLIARVTADTFEEAVVVVRGAPPPALVAAVSPVL